MKKLTATQEAALRELAQGPLLPQSKLFFARGLTKPLVGLGTIASLAKTGYCRMYDTRIILTAAGLDACILRRLAPLALCESFWQRPSQEQDHGASAEA